jgi:hypothetical protein
LAERKSWSVSESVKTILYFGSLVPIKNTNLMAVIFQRKDAAVKKDAEDLTLEDFQTKYKGITTEIVLRSVWKDYNKQVHIKKSIVDNTTASTEYPEPEADPLKDEPEVTTKVKKAKEVPAAKKAATDTPTIPRSQRISELIALKKDKAAAREVLSAEGYEVGGSFHSEWNRLNK